MDNDVTVIDLSGKSVEQVVAEVVANGIGDGTTQDITWRLPFPKPVTNGSENGKAITGREVNLYRDRLNGIQLIISDSMIVELKGTKSLYYIEDPAGQHTGWRVGTLPS